MTIPPKVAKSLFLREISRTFLFGHRDPSGRDVAGRPKATGNGFAQADFERLEDASEEAGAVAQQPAEHAAEQTPADVVVAEAALAADVVVEEAPDVAHDLEAATDELAVFGVEAPYDVAELVIAGKHSALVSEDPAFAVQQTADKPVEQVAVESTEQAGRSRGRTHRSKAQPEHQPGRTDPSC
jgi:hypothetical protein